MWLLAAIGGHAPRAPPLTWTPKTYPRLCPLYHAVATSRLTLVDVSLASNFKP